MSKIDILKPQCRLDDLWVRVITKNDVDLPLPQSRLELYITALITGNIDNLPYPQSRVEMLLYCILTDTEYTFNAQSRVEMFLKAIITPDIEGLPTPMSRLEWYLDYIVRNGCLEKYEYYPFQIRDYLNVKNTPKAKMRFKGMKGNTLVNVVKVSPSSLIELLYPLTKGKIYTWILEFDSNMDCYCMLEESTSWAKLSDTYSVKTGHNFLIIKGLSIPYNYVGTYNISLTNRVNGEYSPDVKFTNRKVTAVEGDCTNCLSSHIEEMKSFGESQNKIEVLSVGKNIHNEREYPLKGEMILSQITGDVEYSKGSYNYTTDFVPMFRKGVVTLSTNDRSVWRKIAYYTKDKKFIKCDFCTDEFLEFYSLPPSNAFFYRLGVNMGKVGLNYTFAQLEYGKVSTSYAEYQGASKAIPMYRNNAGELVPVPVLRGKWENGKFLWGDEIMLHDDGKLYYHKRCEDYLLNGTEGWMLFPGDSTNPRSFYYSLLPGYKFSFDFMVDNRPMIKSKTQDGCWRFDSTDIKIAISDNQSKFATIADFQQHIKENNLRVVLQLPYEEVYPCELTEQLYSFDGETNIFINGGAVVGETVIEVGTKLGPIVATLKQETKIVTDGLKGVLAGDMQELAYQLYPDDFNTTVDTEKR